LKVFYQAYKFKYIINKIDRIPLIHDPESEFKTTNSPINTF